MGITILVPSLTEWRDYLTKAGWKFNTPNQNPKNLYHLTIKSVQQRGNSLGVHDNLRRFLRIEMGEKESADAYTHRVEVLRGDLERLGHYVAEQLVVRITLHGMMRHPDKQGFVKRTVENELAPGSLTFYTLRKLMVDAEKACLSRNKPKQIVLPSPAASSASVKSRGARSAVSQGPSSRASDAQPRHVHFGRDGPARGCSDSDCMGIMNMNANQHPTTHAPKNQTSGPHHYTSDGRRISTAAQGTRIDSANGEVNSVRPTSSGAGWNYPYLKSVPMANVPIVEHTAQPLNPHSFTTSGQRVHNAANKTPAMTEADAARIKEAMSIDRILNPVSDFEAKREVLESDSKRIKEAMSISRILNPEIKAMSVFRMLNPEPLTLPPALLPTCQDTPATRREYFSMDEMLPGDVSRAQPGWSMRVPGAFVDE